MQTRDQQPRSERGPRPWALGHWRYLTGGNVRRWLQTSDPGWLRARQAARSLLGAALGGGLGAGMMAALEQPLAPAMLSALLGLFACRTLPAQHGLRHILRLTGIAIVSSMLAALVSPWLWIANITFVGVMAAAAWATRWGAVGTPFAMTAFLAHFAPRLVDATPSMAPLLAVACVTGAAAAAVAGLWLLSPRPGAALRRLVPALSSQVARVLETLDFGTTRGRDAVRRRLARQLAGVQDTALAIETTLDHPRARSSLAHPDRFRSDVLRAELLLDQFVWRVLTDEASSDGAAEPAKADAGTEPIRQQLATTLSRLHEAAPPRVRSSLRGTRKLWAARPSECLAGPASDTGRLPTPTPSRRTVAQVAVAGALAVVIGIRVSSTYWYWAVIGAFLVIVTTPSRGAGVRKAVERTVGTAIGAGAGLALVAMLAGRAGAEILAMATLLFASFWILQLSYVAMMMLITVIIALLYDLLGVLTPGVIGLRLIETALGAAVGGLVAFFLLPIRTRPTIDAAIVGLLDALEDHLVAVAEERADIESLRHLDQAVAELRGITAPLTAPGSSRLGRQARADRLFGRSIQFRTRALAAALTNRGGNLGPEERTLLDTVRGSVAALRDHLDSPPDLAEHDRPAQALTTVDVAGALRAIDDRLHAYAQSRRLDLSEARSQ